MTIHNHGAEEGAGLACNELRLPDGSLKGACLIPEYKVGFIMDGPPVDIDKIRELLRSLED